MRGFDVVPLRGPEGPRRDLELLTASQRVEVFERLEGVSNNDLFAMGRLRWPRGEHGAWVYLRLGEWFLLCQWDKGQPGLWRDGIGRGTLTICRLADGPGFDEILKERERAAK
ncbi:MAG TPA: hypothetical protein VGN13_13790 [Solirubrobacteraceae bacterium]|jgi:hypothetical protein